MSSWAFFKPFRPPQGLHHALAIGLPVVHGLALQYLSSQGRWPDLAINLAGLLVAVVGSLWGAWLNRHRHGRTLVWISVGLGLALSYLLACVLSPEGWGDKFWPTGLKFGLTGWLLLYGLVAGFWQSNLGPRARLYFLLGTKADEDLRQAMRQYHDDAKFSPAQLRLLQVYLWTISGLTVAAASIQWIFFPSQLGAAGLVATVLGLNHLVSAGLRDFRQEMETLSQGLQTPPHQKLQRVGRTLLLTVAAGLAAVALTSDQVFFPTEEGGGRTTASVVHQPPHPTDGSLTPEAPKVKDLGYWASKVLLLDFFNFRGVLTLLAKLAELVWALLPWVALASLLWPLYKILRTSRWDWRLVRFYLKALANQWIRWIRQLLAAWRRRPVDLEAEVFVPRNSEIWLADRRTTGGPAVTFRDYPWLVREVFRLLAWGDRLKVRYRAGQTISEYLETTAQAVPEARQSLRTLEGLLEIGFFAPGGLDRADQANLADLVRWVTSLGRPAR